MTGERERFEAHYKRRWDKHADFTRDNTTYFQVAVELGYRMYRAALADAAAAAREPQWQCECGADVMMCEPHGFMPGKLWGPMNDGTCPRCARAAPKLSKESA